MDFVFIYVPLREYALAHHAIRYRVAQLLHGDGVAARKVYNPRNTLFSSHTLVSLRCGWREMKSLRLLCIQYQQDILSNNMQLRLRPIFTVS